MRDPKIIRGTAAATRGAAPQRADARVAEAPLR